MTSIATALVVSVGRELQDPTGDALRTSMCRSRTHTAIRRFAGALSLSAAALALVAAPGTASADERPEIPGAVSVLVMPSDLVSTPEPTSAAIPPGPQSCGTSDCVGDFIDACEAAGGVATDTKTFHGPPDGMEVECNVNSSVPR